MGKVSRILHVSEDSPVHFASAACLEKLLFILQAGCLGLHS